MFRYRSLTLAAAARVDRVTASFFCLVLLAFSTAGAQDSLLWKFDGDRWSAKSRLPDFSWAGHGGEQVAAALPTLENWQACLDVEDHILVDTNHDLGFDYAPVFQAAIDELAERGDGGTICIPCRTYNLDLFLSFTDRGLSGLAANNVRLYGQSHDGVEACGARLHFRKTLQVLQQELAPEDFPFFPSGQSNDTFSHTGALIWVGGRVPEISERQITAIDFSADQANCTHDGIDSRCYRRGENEFLIEDASELLVDDWVLIAQKNQGDGHPNRRAFLQHLSGGDLDLLDLDGKFAWDDVELGRFPNRVESIDGNLVTFARSLRWDVVEDWEPQIYDLGTQVSGVGFQNLTISFDAVPSAQHQSEPGANAFLFEGARDCWMKDVVIKNADSVLDFAQSHFCTVDGLNIDADFGRDPSVYNGNDVYGHHAVTYKSFSTDNVVRNFSIWAPYIHDLSLASGSNGNVYADGWGQNLSFDHHAGGSFENLFSNIDVGAPIRVWESSGNADSIKSGARQTYWNIFSDGGNIPPPPETDPEWGWRHSNFVGLQSSANRKISCFCDWREPGTVTQPNLYDAQLDLWANGGPTGPDTFGNQCEGGNWPGNDSGSPFDSSVCIEPEG